MSVYFILDSECGAVKIGITDNEVRKRVQGLQVSTPHELTMLGSIEGGEEEEAQWHIRHESSRIRGEWFRLTPALASDIERAVVEGLVVDLEALREKANAIPRTDSSDAAWIYTTLTYGRMRHLLGYFVERKKDLAVAEAILLVGMLRGLPDVPAKICHSCFRGDVRLVRVSQEVTICAACAALVVEVDALEEAKATGIVDAKAAVRLFERQHKERIAEAEKEAQKQQSRIEQLKTQANSYAERVQRMAVFSEQLSCVCAVVPEDTAVETCPSHGRIV